MMLNPVFLDIETVPAKEPDGAIRELAKDVCVVKFASLSPWLCRVVCVGVIGTREQAIVGKSEHDILHEVNLGLASCRSPLVTFNGRGFDLPVLVNRMLVNGVEPCGFLMSAFQESRYKPVRHYDLMDLLSGYGASKRPSLREVCLGFGLPDPKANGDGEKVSELVAAGEWDRVASYCMGDVRALQALWAKVGSVFLRRAG